MYLAILGEYKKINWVMVRYWKKINFNIQNISGDTLFHILLTNSGMSPYFTQNFKSLCKKSKVDKNIFNHKMIRIKDLLSDNKIEEEEDLSLERETEDLVYRMYMYCRKEFNSNVLVNWEQKRSFVEENRPESRFQEPIKHKCTCIYWVDSKTIHFPCYEWHDCDLVFILIIDKEKKISHANVLFIDKNLNQWHRYEPHGRFSKVNILYNGDLLDKNIHEGLLNKMKNVTPFKYSGLGLQHYQSKEYKRFRKNGYCLYWCFLIIILYNQKKIVKSFEYNFLIKHKGKMTDFIEGFVRTYFD